MVRYLLIFNLLQKTVLHLHNWMWYHLSQSMQCLLSKKKLYFFKEYHCSYKLTIVVFSLTVITSTVNTLLITSSAVLECKSVSKFCLLSCMQNWRRLWMDFKFGNENIQLCSNLRSCRWLDYSLSAFPKSWQKRSGVKASLLSSCYIQVLLIHASSLFFALPSTDAPVHPKELLIIWAHRTTYMNYVFLIKSSQ